MARRMVSFAIIAFILLGIDFSVQAQKKMTVDEYVGKIVPRIVQAIIDGDLTALKHYHNLNSDVFRRVVETIPLLHGATEVGEPAIAEFLISKGANVNLVNHGETPLDIACEWADHRLIEMLIINGADKASRKRAWMKLTAMRFLFEKKGMTLSQLERNGVTRTIRMEDIELSLAVLRKLGVTISG